MSRSIDGDADAVGQPQGAVDEAGRKVLREIRDFFITSHDFNGIPISVLQRTVDLSASQLEAALRSLVETGKVALAFASISDNPHIKRGPELAVADQLSHLGRALSGADQCCAYPSADVIRETTDLTPYDDRPFTRRLALAEPQLQPVFFSLEVLDRYSRDPRYQFDFHDYQGSISVVPDHYEGTSMRARDKTFLQSFAIGYDAERRRVVAVFLRYLSDLTPEHQQSWRSYTVDERCTLNSDYRRATIWGEWPEFHSAYAALMENLVEINKLCAIIGKPALFRTTDRPKALAPMLRPTKRNLNEFTLLLDQLLSDNINKQFFRGDIELERLVPQKGGAMERQQKGTLALLEEWLDSRYSDTEGNRVGKEISSLMRDVRELRQKPAHRSDDDAYDDDYPKEQDELVGQAVHSLTKLRLVLMSHPAAKGAYEPPDWLDGDRIVFY